MFRFGTRHASAMLLLSSIALLLFSSASASSHTCTNSFISVKADETADYDDICSSAEDALTFFKQLNLEPMHPLVVEVVPSLPDTESRTAIGCYLEENERILVLTYAAVQERETWFGVAVDRSIYLSLVTHEVAHAVASCNFAIPNPTIQAKEYVAYVAMFAMMDPNLREQIMAGNPGFRFDSEQEMNELVYMFDPMRFGIGAYRHYLKEGEGNKFLLRVLSGNALTNRGTELPGLRSPLSSRLVATVARCAVDTEPVQDALPQQSPLLPKNRRLYRYCPECLKVDARRSPRRWLLPIAF